MIVIGERTVNPSGMATLVDPRVLSPVFVMFIEYVASWLMSTSVGDIVAVNR